MCVLLDFARSEGIDLPARIRAGTALTPCEAGRFVSWLFWPDHGRNVGPHTVAIRLNAAVRYCKWSFATLNPKMACDGQVDTALQAMTALKPRVGGNTGSRTGLDDEQVQCLADVLHRIADAAAPGSESEFVADRGLLIFDWALELGIRAGELLGVRLGDLDFRRPSVRIVRRPDAMDDPRKAAVRVKGEGRLLPLSRYLADRTEEHVREQRARRPHTTSHAFLFVAVDGSPLSAATLAKFCRRLCREEPRIGARFSFHAMRHTWNERFSEDAAAAGLSEADEVEARRISMGWRDQASARPYMSGHMRKRLSDVALTRQARLLGARGDGHE